MDGLAYTAAICGETITPEADNFLILTVSRRDSDAVQEFFAHRDCLVQVLRPEMPLGEVFDFG
jgi:hypothetical protein